MIKIKLFKENNKVKKIIIMGHANYADYGKDIVCAAVSSTVITSVNIALSIDSDSLSYKKGNDLEIIINKDDIITEKIINVLISNLVSLVDMYPKNIEIKEENNEINGI